MAAAGAGIDPQLKSDRLRKIPHCRHRWQTGRQKHKTTPGSSSKRYVSRQDRSGCVEKLVAAPHGLQALKISLRSDVSSAFINESSANLLRYITDDSVRQLCSGQLLRDILVAVLEPPTFWNALERCYDEKTLSTSGVHAFACTAKDRSRHLP